MNLKNIARLVVTSLMIVGVVACGSKKDEAPATASSSVRTDAEKLAAADAALKTVSDREEALKNLGLEVTVNADGVVAIAPARTEVTAQEQLTAVDAYIVSLQNADLKADVAGTDVAVVTEAKLKTAQAKKAELEAALNPAPAVDPAPAPAVDPAPAPAVDPAPAPAVDPAPAPAVDPAPAPAVDPAPAPAVDPAPAPAVDLAPAPEAPVNPAGN